MSEDQFAKFRSLLESNFQFPCAYTHKIIGANSTLFKNSVAELEAKFIGLTKTAERLSSSGKHISLTFEYQAASSEDVVQLMIETQKLNDLIYIL
jgi:putative lipoic acid-binding regulatory protein